MQESFSVTLISWGLFRNPTVPTNTFLLVTNYFMNWREANTIPNHEAVMVTSKIVDEFVSRFGMPWQLHSYQGRNFESVVFK